ncbi:acyl-CoA synthetase, partial [Mesorhizobium sp. M2D.F.Ca.ET.223.01.1.1]|uniref:AMP-binding protein n=1 Tax=Mesorhizobium sp. M2D.F.Ca.ET.223.01.1.1 TaxID=2563940 RepID=UPI0011337E76
MPAWTTPDPVAMHARVQPDRLACVDLASGRRWTYAALDDAIQRAVAVLESHGIGQGQRIATLARNSADLVILQQAAMRLGAIFVPVNWRLAAVERQVILADCGPSLLVHDAGLDITAPSGCAAVAIARFAAAVEAAAPAARRPLPEADRPSIILYTSG